MEKTKFLSTWRNKWITSGAGSINSYLIIKSLYIFQNIITKKEITEKMTESFS